MSPEEALAIVLEAAEIRADQWRTFAGGNDPADTVDEMYGAGDLEAEEIADRLDAAITIVRGTENALPSIPAPKLAQARDPKGA